MLSSLLERRAPLDGVCNDDGVCLVNKVAHQGLVLCCIGLIHYSKSCRKVIIRQPLYLVNATLHYLTI